jgi:hypothetical protein
MSVIERPEIAVVSVEEFVREFDCVSYDVLVKHLAPEHLVSIVYGDELSGFLEWVENMEGDELIKTKGDELQEVELHDIHDRNVAHIHQMVESLRMELRGYVIEQLPELKLRPQDVRDMYFNQTTGYAQLRPV